MAGKETGLGVEKVLYRPKTRGVDLLDGDPTLDKLLEEQTQDSFVSIQTAHISILADVALLQGNLLTTKPHKLDPV